MNRRGLLRWGAASMLILVRPLKANPAHDAQFRSWLAERFGTADVTEERVTVELPALAENGNSVPLSVIVDSPMRADDYVRTIDVYAPQNPLPHLGRFTLSPSSGIARVNTRIRLGGDQTVRAVAQTSGGRVLTGGADIVVTEAACLDFLI